MYIFTLYKIICRTLLIQTSTLKYWKFGTYISTKILTHYHALVEQKHAQRLRTAFDEKCMIYCAAKRKKKGSFLYI